MDPISSVREAIVKALSSPPSFYHEQDLFDELTIQKPRLKKLLQVPPPNAQEQREIQSGKIKFGAKTVGVNGDFARQVTFLSQQIDCSEKLVAEILYNVMSENPNIDPEQCLEAVVLSYHQSRRHLVDCLRFLFEAAEAAGSAPPSPIYARVQRFVLEELVGEEVGEQSLASQVFKGIQSLDTVLARVDAAKRTAGSKTVAPSAQANAALGSDILQARYDSLKYERRGLAVVLCIISRMGYLSSAELKAMIEWLSTNPSHPMTFYILTSFLVALDPVPAGNTRRVRDTTVGDSVFISFMSRKFAPATAWRDQGLKGLLLLKWTLFLTELRHQDPKLEHRPGFTTEELETQIWNAVQGDAFTYLALAILQLQRRRGEPISASLLSDQALSQEQIENREVPAPDFVPVVQDAFEILVRCLITHASSELRKIKQRQEDLVHVVRPDRSRVPSMRFSASLAPEADRPNTPPRNDIAMLYTFIGLLYSALPPERALQFWGSLPQGDPSQFSYLETVESRIGKLPAFLQWSIWSTSIQDATTLTALYDMLAGLARGQFCSELAHNFMARGTGEVIPGSMLPASSSSGQSVSWDIVFSLLDSWANTASNPRALPPPNPLGNAFGGMAAIPQSQPQQAIGPKDVLLAQAFLRLLSTVVSFSHAVRRAISRHSQFKPIQTLMSLIPLAIPLELKGALFNTLSAFCDPGAGLFGVDDCKMVWTLMERWEIINVRVAPAPYTSVLSSVKGVEVELDEVEAVHRVYPATIPFLKLLSTLLHTPKRIPLKERLADSEPINTIPENLGSPYRLPGIGPFVSFVIDNVFANIPNREYANMSDRWQINDLCLCFVERALASYDLESLAALVEEGTLNGEKLLPTLIHPGYEITKRLLTNSPFQASILAYMVEGVEGFEQGLAQKESFFRNTIIRVLRIVHRLLEIQDIFLDILIPLLGEFDSAPIVGTVHPRSYFTKFYQALSFGQQYIPAIAAYISYNEYPELVLLSIKILSKLSLSSAFPTLATLVQRSAYSERILTGFTNLIGAESLDDVWEAEATADQTTGAGAPDPDGSELLVQAIRTSALDLLTQDTDPSRPYPNLSHYLLFGETKPDFQIQDPHALGARRTSIHIIIHLVNVGVPRVKGKGKVHDRHSLEKTPLFATQPGLAERCYRVLYQLCMHPRTSDVMTRYLRTREDFFARQLSIIPARAPEAIKDVYVQLQYSDNSRVITTVPALTSFLRLRSCIFDLVALELHILTNKGHFKAVSELLDILFGIPGFSEETFEGDTFRPFLEPGQSHMRIVEFLQSLMFDWSDSLEVAGVKLEYLGQLNFISCVRRDTNGCDVLDRSALLSLLVSARRTLHSQGAVATQTQADQLNKETNYILESCVVENHRREVLHSITIGYEAWRRLLDMTLVKCFDRLPRESRENMLFDLLHVLPAAISLPNIEESTSVLLAETVLSTITKLREDRRHQVIIQSAGGDPQSGVLPAERLFTILQSIVEAILRGSRAELVRGNLYAALINYIHLAVSSREQVSAASKPQNGLSLSTSTSRDEILFSSTSQALALAPSPSPAPTSLSSLESGSLGVLKPHLNSLVTVIARDAIDGTEVWKTIAFMLLDALVQLSGGEKAHTVLSALNRNGHLSNFVQGVKEVDARLQAVLKPDPDDLNALYVYEAKMSYFIRMSQTRAGAEKLIEAKLIPTLAQCDYLDARPEADQSFMDQDSFLPSAIQRYHQLIMPALQLVDGMIATLGAKHRTLSQQALDFLTKHSATIAILLKNETEYNTLNLLDEIHLIVVLCSSVLPSVPKSEVVTPTSGFGAIHAAILVLATRSLGRGQCFKDIVPVTEAETKSTKTFAFGHGSESLFELNVRRKERLLRKSIIAYLGAASEFTEPEITIVLSPVTTTPRSDDRGSHFTATIPTIGDAVEALNDLCGELSEAFKQISDISAELSSPEHIDVNQIREIAHDIPAAFLNDLDTSQKRALICQELESVRASAKKESKILLDTTEMLLLLLWRHLDQYTDSSVTSPAPAHSLSASTLTAMRFLTPPNPESIKMEMSKRLAPSLGRLGMLVGEVSEETVGREWMGNKGYLEIMCRRLRDCVGLLGGTLSASSSMIMGSEDGMMTES